MLQYIALLYHSDLCPSSFENITVDTVDVFTIIYYITLNDLLVGYIFQF